MVSTITNHRDEFSVPKPKRKKVNYGPFFQLVNTRPKIYLERITRHDNQRDQRRQEVMRIANLTLKETNFPNDVISAVSKTSPECIKDIERPKMIFCEDSGSIPSYPISKSTKLNVFEVAQEAFRLFEMIMMNISCWKAKKIEAKTLVDKPFPRVSILDVIKFGLFDLITLQAGESATLSNPFYYWAPDKSPTTKEKDASQPMIHTGVDTIREMSVAEIIHWQNRILSMGFRKSRWLNLVFFQILKTLQCKKLLRLDQNNRVIQIWFCSGHYEGVRPVNITTTPQSHVYTQLVSGSHHVDAVLMSCEVETTGKELLVVVDLTRNLVFPDTPDIKTFSCPFMFEVFSASNLKTQSRIEQGVTFFVDKIWEYSILRKNIDIVWRTNTLKINQMLSDVHPFHELLVKDFYNTLIQRFKHCWN
jgi:hypothetical protein